MRYVFPFNSSATNVIMLVAITMSYICFPFVALIVTNVACSYFPAISEYDRMYYSSAAFLFVGVYSLIGVIAMYISFFNRKRKYGK